MRAERERRRAEELCAAAVRALAGEPGLHFRGGRLHDGRRPVPLHAPHLRPAGEPWRGAGDGMALHLLHTDRDLHRGLRPESGVERLLFELLEQFRAEAQVPATWPGARRNLRERFERWSLAYHHDGHADTARGLLFYTVAQVCRARITGEPVVAETEDLIEPTRAAIAPSLGADLAGLRRTRRDQAAFARHARSLAAEVAALLTSDDAGDSGDAAAEEGRDSPLALLLDFDDEPGDGGAVALRERAVGDEQPGYRVFTTAYDREAGIASLVRPAALAGYRERLDREVERQGVNVARLARELEAVLAEPARDGWDGAQEEGLIDGRALARLISSPEERRLFRVERTRPVADVHVTFLIDCSGSMKQHAERVAVLVDLFARALDLLGARSEILGFTTGAWHGGRARRDWLRAGSPPVPGRLNERLHVVFKDAETPWRRARPDIAGLLKADLFREGADGEAVAWAAARARDAGRRALLFVLSDGSPMDGATALANGERYLDDHLREVVSAFEQEGAVEVYGLGVGLDLSPYYRHCLALDTGEGTGHRVFREIVGLIAASRRQ
ncbi:cobaltochelatase CobT-related protein [Prauserella endophytica]|uniref:Cobalt chelatase n=1 Tax=Prauserella endophytica TaxID=1592324 RepID=A0ABY2SBE9_9PSEU|nr:cobalt chelatase [Prauserella endophytica]PXY29158.1 cobalt chelatase [Prauserella coralliicola]TKG72851.1 cobalt chelatase [Prauserella endophytica]